MKCKKGHNINLTKQLANWEKNYGDECAGLDMLLLIKCYSNYE